MVNRTINKDFQILIEDGKRKAIRTGRDVLVSFVSAVEPADPLAFFSYHGARFSGKRFFWSDPGNGVTFVGLGRVMANEPSDAVHRFEEIEREWRQIAGNALVSADAPAYAGPLFFGGFSFDPEKPGTELWEHFPHTRFVVPEFMLTVTDGRSWLTVNKVVSPAGEDYDSDGVDIPGEWGRAFVPGWMGTRILKEEIEPSRWMKSVEEAARSVRGGELEKIVLARELRLYAKEPFVVEDVLARLYSEHKNTYVFALEQGEHCLIGATPERLVKCSGSRLLSTCLAGSIARGKTAEEDEALERTLLDDFKNLHEHALAVKMIGETMRRLCDDVDMPDGPILYKLKDIQHLYTPVTGKTKEGVTILKVLEALHPTPALGGLPQRKAVESIRRLEQMDRGWYAAPIGWMNRNLDGEFAAAIRSALIRGKEASLFAGCGIVGDSEPHSEYHETSLKFRPMLSALGAMNQDA